MLLIVFRVNYLSISHLVGRYSVRENRSRLLTLSQEDEHNSLTLSLEFPTTTTNYRTPSWHANAIGSEERVDPFDLHRSVDSLNSDM